MIIISYEHELRSKDIKYKVTTSLRDEFYVYEKYISGFPDEIYDLYIYQYINKEERLICKDHAVEGTPNEKISLIYSGNETTGYIYSNYVIYKNRTSKYYKALDINELNNLDPEQNKCLVPVVEEVLKRKWEDATLVVQFLAYSHDTQALNLLKRFANGDLTKEELKYNGASEMSKEELQEICDSYHMYFQ